MKLTMTVATGKQALEKPDTLERFHLVPYSSTTSVFSFSVSSSQLHGDTL